MGFQQQIAAWTMNTLPFNEDFASGAVHLLEYIP
jgi:hypothetical protein